jgi:hypothetical protein
MGHKDKGERMENSYSIEHWAWKWTKKLHFHPLDLTILNSFIILSLCGVRMTHRQFTLDLIQNMIQKAGSLVFRLKKQVSRLKLNFSNHCPIRSSRLYCCVFSAYGIKRRWQVKCKNCNVGLCIGAKANSRHDVVFKGFGNFQRSSSNIYVTKIIILHVSCRICPSNGKETVYGSPGSQR